MNSGVADATRVDSLADRGLKPTAQVSRRPAAKTIFDARTHSKLSESSPQLPLEFMKKGRPVRG
jgi:hypothetical protein